MEKGLRTAQSRKLIYTSTPKLFDLTRMDLRRKIVVRERGNLEMWSSHVQEHVESAEKDIIILEGRFAKLSTHFHFKRSFLEMVMCEKDDKEDGRRLQWMISYTLWRTSDLYTLHCGRRRDMKGCTFAIQKLHSRSRGTKEDIVVLERCFFEVQQTCHTRLSHFGIEIRP